MKELFYQGKCRTMVYADGKIVDEIVKKKSCSSSWSIFQFLYFFFNTLMFNHYTYIILFFLMAFQQYHIDHSELP